MDSTPDECMASCPSTTPKFRHLVLHCQRQMTPHVAIPIAKKRTNTGGHTATRRATRPLRSKCCTQTASSLCRRRARRRSRCRCCSRRPRSRPSRRRLSWRPQQEAGRALTRRVLRGVQAWSQFRSSLAFGGSYIGGGRSSRSAYFASRPPWRRGHLGSPCAEGGGLRS